MYPHQPSAQPYPSHPATWQALLQGCTHLHPDNISTFFSHKDGSFLQLVAKYRPQLQHINMEHSDASDNDLIELLKSCRELRPENIHGGNRGDLYCKAMASQYQDLKQIVVNNATETGLIELLRGCPGLHPDKITGCDQKGDTFLQAVIRFRPEVTDISLEKCDILSDRGLATLVSALTTSWSEAVMTSPSHICVFDTIPYGCDYDMAQL